MAERAKFTYRENSRRRRPQYSISKNVNISGLDGDISSLEISLSNPEEFQLIWWTDASRRRGDRVRYTLITLATTAR